MSGIILTIIIFMSILLGLFILLTAYWIIIWWYKDIKEFLQNRRKHD